jgi:hypothetical protein
MPKHNAPAAWTSWEDMPLDEFEKRAGQIQEKAAVFVQEVEALLPGLRTLTKEQRKLAPRLRKGEHPLLLRVLQVVDLKPALFESLADEDEGMDPQKFETALLRERIQKHLRFTQIDETLSPIAGKFGDSSLYLASKFRDAVYAAYRISKTHAGIPALNDVLAPVIDFMRRNAVAGAATRASKKKDEDK